MTDCWTFQVVVLSAIACVNTIGLMVYVFTSPATVKQSKVKTVVLDQDKNKREDYDHENDWE